MTEIEKQALALVNEVVEERHPGKATVSFSRRNMSDEALCRAIEQHEQFKREVSDAVEDLLSGAVFRKAAHDRLSHFIIAKPDPLVEALNEMVEDDDWFDEAHAVDLRAALTKRSGKIVWKNEP